MDLPVIVSGHGGNWLRDGLVHVVETGRLDGRKPVVVATGSTDTAAAADADSAAATVRRGHGGWADGRGRGRQRGRRAVLLVESSAATPTLIPQFFFASPLCAPVAEPHLRTRKRFRSIFQQFDFPFIFWSNFARANTTDIFV